MLTGRRDATILAGVLAMAVTMGPGPGARAEESPDPRYEETPPRLSLTDGQVSFWRPGAPDWMRAQINTPLAPGDALSTGSPGTLEVQIGARAFVRAWANTQLSLGAQEPDFLQFTLAAGSAVFDLRALDPGDTVEVDTPNATVTIEQPGYYRVDVAGERSRVMTRRGGRAMVSPAGGPAVAVTPSEDVVIEGTSTPQLAAYAAPPLDEWDRWNYTRTDRLLDAVSARYVSFGTYGASDLDPYGTWRVVPTYGTVWVPTGVPAGWAPYSAGSWIADPVYGWTWVDTAPWGWAPYHYGRWCFVDGVLGLGARLRGRPTAVFARARRIPGRAGCRGRGAGGTARGLGGARVGRAGRAVVGTARRGARTFLARLGRPARREQRGHQQHRGGERAEHHVYRNASVPHAVVAVDRARFGHGPVAGARIAQVDPQRLRPLPGAPQIAATSASLVPTAVRGVRPPPEVQKRLEVAPQRVHRERAAPVAVASSDTPRAARPPDRVVVARPEPQEPVAPLPRPSFGRERRSAPWRIARRCLRRRDPVVPPRDRCHRDTRAPRHRRTACSGRTPERAPRSGSPSAFPPRRRRRSDRDRAWPGPGPIRADQP